MVRVRGLSMIFYATPAKPPPPLGLTPLYICHTWTARRLRGLVCAAGDDEYRVRIHSESN